MSSLSLVAPRNVKEESPILPKKKTLLIRALSHPLGMHYYRLAIAVLLINLATANFIRLNLENILSLVLINFLIANIMRTQPMINIFFKLATAAPTTWPLSIRRVLGKVYHFGGIHVGAYLAGSIWYLHLVLKFGSAMHTAYQVLVSLHLLVLLSIMFVAMPSFRHKYHDQFEVIARFGNWFSLWSFWMLALGSTATPVWHYYLLGLITFCVALPWLTLKKVAINIETPSKHVAIARFKHATPFAGSSTDISLDPLMEWHSFANVPSPNSKGFRLTISRAGDWTGNFIDKVPKQVWVKGITTAGVGNIETLFKKVVWVATGSGIGPCLPHLLKAEVPSMLVWSTRSPEETYGKEFYDEILKTSPDAQIWDTSKYGKPDMLELAYKAYKESGAEAVICISNKRLTWEVVSGLESRGIPAYGAIWDS